MWLKVLLEEFMDVAQSEQTSRTVRIICTIFVSLVLIPWYCLPVSAGISDRRSRSFQKSGLSDLGYWYFSLLCLFFENRFAQNQKYKEVLMKERLPKRRKNHAMPGLWSRDGAGRDRVCRRRL